MLYLKKLATLTLSVYSLAVLHSTAHAADYQYLFNDAFSGTPPASTNHLWMEAIFRDVTNGTVQLTVSNLNLSGTENVDQLYLNLNPTLDATKLHFSYLMGSGSFDLPSITEGTNSYKADGDGKYDILFNFTSNSNDKHQFTQGEWFTYTITGITGLTAADFGYLSFPAGGAGPFYAAAHVQRIGNGSFSGWISADIVTPITPVPEPSAASLVEIALFLFVGFRLWKRASKAAERARQLRPAPIRARILQSGRRRAS
jgi:hypothetical protein